MRRHLVALGFALALVASGIAREAYAEESGNVGEGPRIFSIQPRPYRLGHEFQLGLGVLPLDAFYVGVMPTGSYTFHFSDFWAWEIISLGYSMNFETSLQDDLYEDYGVHPVDEGGARLLRLNDTGPLQAPPKRKRKDKVPPHRARK